MRARPPLLVLVLLVLAHGVPVCPIGSSTCSGDRMIHQALTEGCTVVDGNLVVAGLSTASIDIAALTLTCVTGSLKVLGNLHLDDMSSLSNVQIMGAGIEIVGNEALASLNGLQNTSVGGNFYVALNPHLSSSIGAALCDYSIGVAGNVTLAFGDGVTRATRNGFDYCTLSSVFNSSAELQRAVDAWVANPSLAAQSYGSIELWDDGLVTDVSYLFCAMSFSDCAGYSECESRCDPARENFDGNISRWDVQHVVSMRWAFAGSNYNGDLSHWQTPALVDLEATFKNSGFNQPLLTWDVGKVVTLDQTFMDGSYNQALEGWDVSNVESLRYTFFNSDFNQPLDGWDVGKVTSLSNTFRSARAFNQNLSAWNTGNVLHLTSVFYDARAYDHSPCGWDTSKVQSMKYAFRSATTFNQPLNCWDTSAVHDFQGVFYEAESFNQPLDRWDTSSADTSDCFLNAFRSASAFNQDVSMWTVSQVPGTGFLNVFRDASSLDYCRRATIHASWSTQAPLVWNASGHPEWSILDACMPPPGRPPALPPPSPPPLPPPSSPPSLPPPQMLFEVNAADNLTSIMLEALQSPSSFARIVIAGSHVLSPLSGILDGSTTTTSEIVIEAASGLSAEITPPRYSEVSTRGCSPLLRIGHGSPPVTLVGLVFRGALHVHFDSALVLVRNCTFLPPPIDAHCNGSALTVEAGTVDVHGSLFEGLLEGALNVSGGLTTLYETILRHNLAVSGGAASVRNEGILNLFNCQLEENVASVGGGALEILDRGAVVLGNQTSLKHNRAPFGNLAVVASRALLQYAHPTPLGTWTTMPFQCRVYRVPCASSNCTDHESPELDEQPCNWRDNSIVMGQYVTAFAAGVEHNQAVFPYACPAGTYGSDLSMASQSSSTCTGACPTGHYCSAGVSEPLECPLGSFCPLGSAAPTVCPSGRYGNATGLGAAQDCHICPAGSFCVAGRRLQCPSGSYNPYEGSSDESECNLCPESSSTDTPGATSIDACQCNGGFILDTNTSGSAIRCHCPAGYGIARSGGTQTCSPCAIGTFKLIAGNSICDDCRADRTTLFEGAADPSQCVCKVGRFEKLSHVSCEACPSEVICTDPGATMTTLQLRSGFWRLNNATDTIRACYESELCPNINGNQGCIAGHTGPFCEVCQEAHYRGASGRCVRCEGSLVLVAMLPLTIVVTLVIAIVWLLRRKRIHHLRVAAASLEALTMSTAAEEFLEKQAEANAADKHVKSAALTASGLVVKGRIFVSYVQVLLGLGVSFDIRWPPAFSALLRWLSIVHLDLPAVFPLSCIFGIDFHTSLIASTAAPLLFALCLEALAVCLRRVANRRQMRSKVLRQSALHKTAAGQRLSQEELTAVAGPYEARIAQSVADLGFLVVYLVYPSAVLKIFSTFQCKRLPEGNVRYLRSDFTIDCDESRHQLMQWGYAFPMCLVYPIGVPLLTMYAFWRHRVRLRHWSEEERVATAHVHIANAKLRGLERHRNQRQYKENDEQVAASTAAAQSKAAAEEAAEEAAKVLDLVGAAARMDTALPGYIHRLTYGYAQGSYFWELVEMVRKIFLVGLSVGFDAGSLAQQVYGLLVCFIFYGALHIYTPYETRSDNVIASLCQVSTFSALVLSIIMRSEPPPHVLGGVDAALTALIFLPVVISVVQDLPDLCKCISSDFAGCCFTRCRTSASAGLSGEEQTTATGDQSLAIESNMEDASVPAPGEKLTFDVSSGASSSLMVDATLRAGVDRRSHRDFELDGDETARDRPPTSRQRSTRTTHVPSKAPGPKDWSLTPVMEMSSRLSHTVSALILEQAIPGAAVEAPEPSARGSLAEASASMVFLPLRREIARSEGASIAARPSMYVGESAG